MKPISARSAYFEAVTICGIPGLFSPIPIDRATIPPGMYAYDLQSSEADRSQPVSLAANVVQGYYGSVLTASPVVVFPGSQVELTPGDFDSCIPLERLTVADFESLYLSPAPSRMR